MPLSLRWMDGTRLAVEAEGLRPDLVAGLPADELARRPVLAGNAYREVGELFRVSGEPDGETLVLEGDLSRVRRLGEGMASGRLIIEGNAGDHVGAGMSGGTLEIQGVAGHWAGAMMRGGLLRIRGSAGDHLGAGYPGERVGMREGVILVEGDAGDFAGETMRRGLIGVLGRVGDGLGHALVAGSLFAFGPIGRYAGAATKRGTLALFGPEPPELLPTFAHACRYRPPFLTLYLRQLRAWGFPVPDAAFGGTCERYNGDLTEGGRGEVLVWRPS